MIHFVSDLHYFHKNIILYSQRPFASVEEMNDKLIENWNRVVAPTDTIYSLGDFSFGNYLLTCNVLSQLNGEHHMILGNHDKTIIENQTKLISSGLVKSIQYYKELKYNNTLFVLFHYPMRSWNKKHYDAIHCFGHVHNSLFNSPWGKSIDVGVDSKTITSEYRPVSADEIIVYMLNVKDIMVDHHIKR